MNQTVTHALEVAMAAAEAVRGTTSPNPPVGCAIIRDGDIVGVGATQSPTGSGEHAEVMALRDAGELAHGASAVVTLEPCNHTGRTGPCSHALIDAGVDAVYYATADPNPQAAGGAAYLRAHGVTTVHLDVPVPALRAWIHSVHTGGPHITLKTAHTLDGFSAAQDGTSQWITGEQARAAVHVDRSKRDALIVGTGTVLTDNPQLTARQPDGSLLSHQPVRVVVGTRPIPKDFHLAAKDVLHFDTIEAALSGLWELGLRDILVEGGPTLAGAFLAGGHAHLIQSYINPSILGAGLNAIALPLQEATSMSDIRRFELLRVQRLGDDILVESTIS